MGRKNKEIRGLYGHDIIKVKLSPPVVLKEFQTKVVPTTQRTLNQNQNCDNKIYLEDTVEDKPGG